MPERIGSPPHKVAKKIDQNSHALFESSYSKAFDSIHGTHLFKEAGTLVLGPYVNYISTRAFEFEHEYEYEQPGPKRIDLASKITEEFLFPKWPMIPASTQTPVDIIVFHYSA
jgi:hypothetical protein